MNVDDASIHSLPSYEPSLSSAALTPFHEVGMRPLPELSESELELSDPTPEQLEENLQAVLDVDAPHADDIKSALEVNKGILDKIKESPVTKFLAVILGGSLAGIGKVGILAGAITGGCLFGAMVLLRSCLHHFPIIGTEHIDQTFQDNMDEIREKLVKVMSFATLGFLSTAGGALLTYGTGNQVHAQRNEMLDSVIKKAGGIVGCIPGAGVGLAALPGMWMLTGLIGLFFLPFQFGKFIKDLDEKNDPSQSSPPPSEMVIGGNKGKVALEEAEEDEDSEISVTAQQGPTYAKPAFSTSVGLVEDKPVSPGHPHLSSTSMESIHDDEELDEDDGAGLEQVHLEIKAEQKEEEIAQQGIKFTLSKGQPASHFSTVNLDADASHFGALDTDPVHIPTSMETLAKEAKITKKPPLSNNALQKNAQELSDALAALVRALRTPNPLFSNSDNKFPPPSFAKLEEAVQSMSGEMKKILKASQTNNAGQATLSPSLGSFKTFQEEFNQMLVGIRTHVAQSDQELELNQEMTDAVKNLAQALHSMFGIQELELSQEMIDAVKNLAQTLHSMLGVKEFPIPLEVKPLAIKPNTQSVDEKTIKQMGEVIQELKTKQAQTDNKSP